MKYKSFLFFIVLTSMYLTVYFYRLVSGLEFYYVQVLVYLVLIFLSWNTVERYFRWSHFSAIMLLYTSLVTIVYILLGFLDGFGYSPYSMTPWWIMINVIYTSTKVIGIEFIRVYVIDELLLKSKIAAVLFASFVPWLLMWFPYPVLSLTISTDSMKTLFRYLIPSFADSVLSSYVVIYHGVVPSLIYNITPQLFMKLSPVLPRLHWFVESSFRLIVPLLGYAIAASQTRLRGVYMRRNKQEFSSILKTTRFLALVFLILVLTQGYLGVKPYVITSNSMVPTIHSGDLVIVCWFCSDYKIGDIIAYESRWGIIVHRVVEIDREKNLVITKGDANREIDPEPVSTRNIIGKVVLWVPIIGYLSKLLNEVVQNGNSLGALFLLILLLFLFVFKRITS